MKPFKEPHQGKADSYADCATEENAGWNAKQQIDRVDGSTARQAGKDAEDGDGKDIVDGCSGKNEGWHPFSLSEAAFGEFEHLRNHHGRRNGCKDEAEHAGFEKRQVQEVVRSYRCSSALHYAGDEAHSDRGPSNFFQCLCADSQTGADENDDQGDGLKLLQKLE